MSTTDDTTPPADDPTTDRRRAGEHGRRPPAGHRPRPTDPRTLNDDQALDEHQAHENGPMVVEGEVIDAEPVDDTPPPTRPARRGELARTSGAVARRGTVHLLTTARVIATHDRTRGVVRGAGRHLWFPVAGAAVAVRQWRDAHGNGRYERQMRGAEVAGDREMLLEWEARDVAEKQRRHDRVMDWLLSPMRLVKAAAIAVASFTVLLLGLGVILAVADGEISQIVAPIVGVINLIRWVAWFLAAYGATLLLAATGGGVLYLWALGRNHTQPPAWVAPVAATTDGPGRDVVPDEGAILGALRNLGLAPLDKKLKEGWVPRWVLGTGRDGKGWRTQLELPPGVTVDMINARKTVLAHNLVRLPVEVWPTEPKNQPGVLDLWVADQGLLTGPVEPYPLLEEGTTDYFTGVPAGIDQRGSVVTGKLMASNYGIAGIMGSGKTSLVIELLCGAMLDPLVDIDIYVMAYNVDYDPMKPRLRTLVKGDEDEHVIAAMEALRDLRAEVTARGRILAELGGEETKVTRALAEKDERLRPRVVVFDECQELFRHEEFGEEAKELAIKVMMKARKCAITLVFVTPAPSAANLPRDLAKTTSHSVCFAIGDHQGNDAILGTGAHKQGISATALVPGEDVGTAMATGFATRPGLLRTHHIRKEKGVDQITPIVERAVALRDAAGIEDTAGPVREEGEPIDHLADIAAALRGEPRVLTRLVLARLVERDRHTYESWGFPELAAALAEHEIPPRKSNGQSVVRADDLTAAITERDEMKRTESED